MKVNPYSEVVVELCKSKWRWFHHDEWTISLCHIVFICYFGTLLLLKYQSEAGLKEILHQITVWRFQLNTKSSTPPYFCYERFWASKYTDQNKHHGYRFWFRGKNKLIQYLTDSSSGCPAMKDPRSKATRNHWSERLNSVTPELR